MNFRKLSACAFLATFLGFPIGGAGDVAVAHPHTIIYQIYDNCGCSGSPFHSTNMWSVVIKEMKPGGRSYERSDQAGCHTTV